jgi:hypothetical protein
MSTLGSAPRGAAGRHSPPRGESPGSARCDAAPAAPRGRRTLPARSPRRTQVLGVRTSNGDSSPLDSPVRLPSKGGSGANARRSRLEGAAWKPLREVRPQVRPGRDGCREVRVARPRRVLPADGPHWSGRLAGTDPENGPSRSRSDPGTVRRQRKQQAWRAESSVRVDTDWPKPSNSQDSTDGVARGSPKGAARGTSAEDLPATVPADRLRRAAKDGNRRLPVRRLRPETVALSKAPARRFAAARAPREGCHASASALTGGRRRSRAPDLQVRLPSRVCQWEPPGPRSASVVVLHRGAA